MELNTGKDGTVTAVDGRMFHTGIHRPEKVLVGINESG